MIGAALLGVMLIDALTVIVKLEFVHRPVGMNVYAIHGLAPDTPLSSTVRGILPLLGIDCMHLALLIAAPSLTSWLPSVMELKRDTRDRRAL